MSTVLISGASSGFGALTARALADAGHAGMRDVDGRNAAAASEAEAYSTARGVDLRPVELDVGSDESARRAVTTVLRERGRLDVLVHNAGHMATGPRRGVHAGAAGPAVRHERRGNPAAPGRHVTSPRGDPPPRRHADDGTTRLRGTRDTPVVADQAPARAPHGRDVRTRASRLPGVTVGPGR